MSPNDANFPMQYDTLESCVITTSIPKCTSLFPSGSTVECQWSYGISVTDITHIQILFGSVESAQECVIQNEYDPSHYTGRTDFWATKLQSWNSCTVIKIMQ